MGILIGEFNGRMVFPADTISVNVRGALRSLWGIQARLLTILPRQSCGQSGESAGKAGVNVRDCFVACGSSQ